MSGSTALQSRAGRLWRAVPRERLVHLSVLARTLVFATLVGSCGCQQQMARQPSYRPLQSSSLFPDGLSSRPLVPGTVHRDAVEAFGKKPVDIKEWVRAASVVGKGAASPLEAAASVADLSLFVETFPYPVTAALLARGHERFNIYCALCHDRVGTGHGTIVERGFTPPPNLHTDLSRGFKLRGIEMKIKDAPVGYYFEVISNGFGAMPDYAHQVPPKDRWAIIAHIRALQLSQAATLGDIRDPSEKQRLLESRGGGQ